MKVGDEGKSRLISNLNKLLSVVCSKEHTHREEIIKNCAFGISRLPDKSGIYATFLAMLNNNSHTLVVDICNQTIRTLEQAISENNVSQAKNIIRFLCELSCSKLLKPLALTDIIYSLLNSHASKSIISCELIAIVMNLPYMVFYSIFLYTNSQNY